MKRKHDYFFLAYCVKVCHWPGVLVCTFTYSPSVRLMTDYQIRLYSQTSIHHATFEFMIYSQNTMNRLFHPHVSFWLKNSVHLLILCCFGINVNNILIIYCARRMKRILISRYVHYIVFFLRTAYAYQQLECKKEKNGLYHPKMILGLEAGCTLYEVLFHDIYIVVFPMHISHFKDLLYGRKEVSVTLWCIPFNPNLAADCAGRTYAQMCRLTDLFMLNILFLHYEGYYCNIWSSKQTLFNVIY